MFYDSATKFQARSFKIFLIKKSVSPTPSSEKCVFIEFAIGNAMGSNRAFFIFPRQVFYTACANKILKLLSVMFLNKKR